MISLTDEDLLELADVPALLPARSSGRTVAGQTVRRWAQTGLRGHRLETIRCGGRLLTSKRALMRFLEALSGQKRRPKRAAAG
jgi:hypothetical protein